MPAQKKMDVPDAVYVCNATIGQWLQALKEGINVAEYRTLLQSDLENMRDAMNVITDWAP